MSCSTCCWAVSPGWQTPANLVGLWAYYGKQGYNITSLSAYGSFVADGWGEFGMAGVLIAALVLLITSATELRSQTRYPTRPVNLYVPFPAGSGADVIARIVGKGLETVARQPFIVNDRPGASGAIAADVVKRAAPDGYTVLVGTAATMSILWALKAKPSFDTLRDFVPVTRTSSTSPSVRLRWRTRFIRGHCNSHPTSSITGGVTTATVSDCGGSWMPWTSTGFAVP